MKQKTKYGRLNQKYTCPFCALAHIPTKHTGKELPHYGVAKMQLRPLRSRNYFAATSCICICFHIQESGLP